MKKQFGIRTNGGGLYCYELVLDKDGDYYISGRRYIMKRLSSCSDGRLMNKMAKMCVDRGYQRFDDHGKHPKRIRASKLKGIDCIFVEAFST